MIPCRARVFKTARNLSTLVGRSGRKYIPNRVLLPHPKDPKLDLHLAHCDGEPFVLKPVSKSVFDFSQEFKNEFGNNPRLRIHLDENKEKNILVYEYFKTDLLWLMRNYPYPFPIKSRKAILKEVGLVLIDIHAKNWLHLDLKPDNVFLDWYTDEKKQLHLQKVVLGDMDWAMKLEGEYIDCALKLEGDVLVNQKFGNVRWRSPEGQLGKGIGKPSEVFSFALLCLHVLTSAECFCPKFQDPNFDKVEPEIVVLTKLLCAFGPPPDALVKHVNDKKAGALLEDLWHDITELGWQQPFEEWSEEMFAENFSNLKEAKPLILRMTNLDPAKRAVMSDIMKDPYWN